jgi:hypothetical protein
MPSMMFESELMAFTVAAFAVAILSPEFYDNFNLIETIFNLKNNSFESDHQFFVSHNNNSSKYSLNSKVLSHGISFFKNYLSSTVRNNNIFKWIIILNNRREDDIV